MWISPTYQHTDFRWPLSLEDKVRIFEDRTLGWKLDIADQMINGRRNARGGMEIPPIPHAGYAVLDIVFSYFEMVAKYQAGSTTLNQSRQHFKEGVLLVFPGLRGGQVPAYLPGAQGRIVSVLDYVLEELYEYIRYGIYHNGVTTGPVVLRDYSLYPMTLDVYQMALEINPHLLAPALKAHFREYIEDLFDSQQRELRRKFEIRFDFDMQVKYAVPELSA